MQHFHAVLRPLHPRAEKSGRTIWLGQEVIPLRVPPAAGSGSFARSYEQLAEALREMPRLFLEPDGSFGWVARQDVTQRLDGQITDDGQRVMFVDLQGRCDFSLLEALLVALGWPQQPLMFQILPDGFVLDEATFFQVLWGRP